MPNFKSNGCIFLEILWFMFWSLWSHRKRACPGDVIGLRHTITLRTPKLISSQSDVQFLRYCDLCFGADDVTESRRGLMPSSGSVMWCTSVLLCIIPNLKSIGCIVPEITQFKFWADDVTERGRGLMTSSVSVTWCSLIPLCLTPNLKSIGYTVPEIMQFKNLS